MDDAQIATLNDTYRGIKGPTNVLAFSMREGAFGGVSPHLLGDVVISMDTLAREADAAGKPLEAHFKMLLVHGMLHLFGYDHQTDAQENAMEQKAGELLALI